MPPESRTAGSYLAAQMSTSNVRNCCPAGRRSGFTALTTVAEYLSTAVLERPRRLAAIWIALTMTSKVTADQATMSNLYVLLRSFPVTRSRAVPTLMLNVPGSNQAAKLSDWMGRMTVIAFFPMEACRRHGKRADTSTALTTKPAKSAFRNPRCRNVAGVAVYSDMWRPVRRQVVPLCFNKLSLLVRLPSD